MALSSRLLLSATRREGSSLRGKCQAELWKGSSRCLSLSLTRKGERSDGEEQPLFIIDDETLNVISPKLKDADPRDVPLMNLRQDSLSSSATPPPSQLATPPQDGTLPIVRMTIKDQWYQKLPIVHVKATYNNTIFTITDPTGKVLAWTSSGAVGFKNARRGTTFAAQSAAMTAAQKARELGFQKVQVKIKGPGPGRQPSIKGLEGGGLQIVSIQDVTPVPHNGCRPRKARRL